MNGKTTSRITIAQAADFEEQSYYRGAEPSLSCEIQLAGDLATALRMTMPQDRLRRALATDAAEVFLRLEYGRSFDRFGGCVIRTERRLDDLPIGNDWILTPDSIDWEAWRDVVDQHLGAWHYPMGGGRHGDGFGRYAMARAAGEKGYAIAESLATLAIFGLEADDSLIEGSGDFEQAAAAWNAAKRSPAASRSAAIRARHRS